MFETTTRWPLVALLLPWSLAFAANGPDAAAGWLAKMSRAAQTLNYDGTFVYLHDNSIETMRVIHKAEKGNEYERLVSLNGSSREVIRNGDVVTCVLPNSKRVVVDKNQDVRTFPLVFSANANEIDRHYHLEVEGSDRIAGIDARIISIAPKDRYRYGYRLWMDEESGLLLKFQLIGGDGESIEQMMFTSLKILDHVPDKLLAPQIDSDELMWIAEENADELPIDRGWRFAWLPSGFQLSEHYKRRLSTTGTPVDHMILTDGITMVSVFIESVDAKRTNVAGLSKKGAVNAYSTIIAEHKVTAVGEVPADTVRRITSAVQYRPNKINQADAND